MLTRCRWSVVAVAALQGCARWVSSTDWLGSARRWRWLHWYLMCGQFKLLAHSCSRWLVAVHSYCQIWWGSGVWSGCPFAGQWSYTCAHFSRVSEWILAHDDSGNARSFDGCGFWNTAGWSQECRYYDQWWIGRHCDSLRVPQPAQEQLKHLDYISIYSCIHILDKHMLSLTTFRLHWFWREKYWYSIRSVRS